jgi:predicted nucleic acid-binding protein
LIYVDTSALVKLVIREVGSDAVDRYLTDADLVSSTLLLVEARRGALRRAPAKLPHLDLVLRRVEMIEISSAVVEAASRLPDPALRLLDAIHLATALLVREDIEALLTYDDRLAAAAAAHGLAVIAPA